MNNTLQLPSQIYLDELLKDYKVINIDAFELYLTGIWKDLASRSDNKYMGINKITFSKYYELPGIIFDRLFSVFDPDKSEYVNLNNFISGMLTLFTKDFDELVKFIFRFYDFDKDGKISKEDIRIVLSYVPLNKNKNRNDSKFEERVESQDELHKVLDSVFNKGETIDESEFIKIVENTNSDIFLFILIFLLEKRPFNDKTILLLENIKKSPVTIEASPKNSKLIASPNLNSIFQPGSTISKSPIFNQSKSKLIDTNVNKKRTDSLNLAQKDLLYKYAGKKPKTRCIPQFKPNVTIKKKEVRPTAPSRKRRLILKELNDFDKLSAEIKVDWGEDIMIQPVMPYEERNRSAEVKGIDSEDSEVSEEEENKDEEDDKVKGNYSGYMYKLISHGKKIKKFWFSLVYKDLYYYKSNQDTLHKGMYNLSGVFLKEEKEVDIDDKHMYSFSIITQEKTRRYFVKNKNEFDNWIINLKKAIGFSTLNDLYEIKEKISSGRCGVVKKGINKKTNEEVAIKIMSKNNMSTFDLEQVKNEIEILKIANHPNIIKLYNVYESVDYIYIIMEYYSGGDLFSYLEQRNFKLKEERAAQIIHQLSAAVYFLHEYGIIHRDLKPENIIMTNQTETADIKLLDFGLGKMIGPNELCNDFFGTLSYVSPEVLEVKPYTKSVDLWAIGVITYLLLSGYLPFDDENSEREIARQTKEDPVAYPPSIWRKISKEGKDFVDNLLNKDPKKRMTIKEVLEHQWIRKHCNIVSTSELSEKLTGGQEFKLYSSPVLQTRQNSLSIPSSSDSPSSNNGNNTQQSTFTSVPMTNTNTLGIPLPNINLPIYTNKNPNL